MSTYLGLVVAFLLMMSSPPTAAAQSGRGRLATVKRLSCTFAAMATGTWSGGEAQGTIKPTTLSFRFEEIDAEDGTARVVGPFGPSDIIVRLSGETLHLMQSFREGPLYATTIFGSETRNGRLKAVHTRHEFTEVTLPGFTSRPEQYYGECDLDPPPAR